MSAIRRGLLLALTAFSISFLHPSFAAPASAQERSAVRPGFSLPTNGNVRILLLRPRIRVGERSTFGLFEPNADWTQQARENVAAALAEAQSGLGNRIIMQEEPVGQDAQVLADYMTLFSAVADSVINYQFFRGNRLPTKVRENRTGGFDWTLGSGVGGLPGAADADYALFINTEDHFGSTGRKVLQVLAAIGRVHVEAGLHKGHAGLIDLRTGALVWINADMRMGGDVRTPEGARRRVAQLLEDFPGRPAPAAAAQ